MECPSATPETDNRKIIQLEKDNQDLTQNLESMTTQLHEAQDQVRNLEAQLQV